VKEEDIDILEFLLTSDYDDINYSRDQFIYLLKKYKNFYQILNAKYHRDKDSTKEANLKLKEKEDQILKLESKILSLQGRNENLKKKLNKKLTFKERFLGKLRR